MGCDKVVAPTFQVMVANGDQLQCAEIYKFVPMEIQGYKFHTSMYPLELQGSDMVLGVQWLQSLGRVIHDWKNLTMKFTMDGKEHVIRGDAIKTILYGMVHSLQKLMANGLTMFMMQMVKVTDSLPLNAIVGEHTQELEHLLTEYQQIFQVPTTLPPPQSHDHQINLEPGTKPVNVHPYRYPHIQKNEIERAVKEMLATGIIQPSTNPFSSPMLLVKKKDGSWRFCVDYHALNQITIKDRYPIPVIDELLDKLHGASYFTKLDLKSKYHQIQVQLGDVHKTAFRTHDGHYEFLAMPFGLTNAPSTFQSLMNDIFLFALQRYVLVFFDDILIFSKTWVEHMEHLKTVFHTLLTNQLYVNHSKCLIGQQQVEYLGHIISPLGVSADLKKIKCMQTWPTPTTVTALRGFLGLIGYYRKFTRHYGSIAAPLTRLLQKDAFV